MAGISHVVVTLKDVFADVEVEIEVEFDHLPNKDELEPHLQKLETFIYELEDNIND